MVAEVNEQSTVSRRAFLVGMVATGVAVQTKDAVAEDDKKFPAFRPNIVYIHSHDTGRYLSPYGQFVPSPNIERLAQEGVLFRKAFSAAPTCSPAGPPC
jgi:N-sulfoglucosamine sulfohydrolase